MQNSLQNINPNVKGAFIQLSLSLEPEMLFQDGERSQTQVEKARKEIDILWKRLELVHNVTVSLEQAEQWAWEK